MLRYLNILVCAVHTPDWYFKLLFLSTHYILYDFTAKLIKLAFFRKGGGVGLHLVCNLLIDLVLVDGEKSYIFFMFV